LKSIKDYSDNNEKNNILGPNLLISNISTKSEENEQNKSKSLILKFKTNSNNSINNELLGDEFKDSKLNLLECQNNTNIWFNILNNFSVSVEEVDD